MTSSGVGAIQLKTPAPGMETMPKADQEVICQAEESTFKESEIIEEEEGEEEFPSVEEVTKRLRRLTEEDEDAQEDDNNKSDVEDVTRRMRRLTDERTEEEAEAEVDLDTGKDSSGNQHDDKLGQILMETASHLQSLASISDVGLRGGDDDNDEEEEEDEQQQQDLDTIQGLQNEIDKLLAPLTSSSPSNSSMLVVDTAATATDDDDSPFYEVVTTAAVIESHQQQGSTKRVHRLSSSDDENGASSSSRRPRKFQKRDPDLDLDLDAITVEEVVQIECNNQEEEEEEKEESDLEEEDEKVGADTAASVIDVDHVVLIVVAVAVAVVDGPIISLHNSGAGKIVLEQGEAPRGRPSRRGLDSTAVLREGEAPARGGGPPPRPRGADGAEAGPSAGRARAQPGGLPGLVVEEGAREG